MIRICLKAMAGLTLFCFIVAASNCDQPRAVAIEPEPDATLKDLQNLDELRALFNKEKDSPRLILLLSPT